MDAASQLENLSKRRIFSSFGLLAVAVVLLAASLAVHLWVSFHALRMSGLLAALATFILPVIGDAYWGIRQWAADGPTRFAVAANLVALLGLLSYPLSALASRWLERSRAGMLGALDAATKGAAPRAIEDVELLREASDDPGDDELALTPRHLDVLRHVRLDWNGCDFGAPCFDPDRPFGDGDFWETLTSLTGAASREQAAGVWVGMGHAWKAFIRRATLEPGRYRIHPVSRGSGPPVEEIEATEEMLVLARALGEGIAWESHFRFVPSPSCDPKRPYGDYTHYPIDMARVLGWKDRIDASGDHAELSEEDDTYLENLHYQSMLPTLQAILQHGRL